MNPAGFSLSAVKLQDPLLQREALENEGTDLHPQVGCNYRTIRLEEEKDISMLIGQGLVVTLSFGNYQISFFESFGNVIARSQSRGEQ